MTINETVERCTRALLRAKGYNEELWQQYPHAQNDAKNVVICLIELGLIKAE
jgi:hypothetical protein